MEISKATRRRGVMLTSVGLKRLQAAILRVEIAENNGNRFSMEQLSDRIKISTKTLTRLWSSNASVDRKTLKLCFNAFNLELRREDYTILSEPNYTESFPGLLTNLDKKDIYALELPSIKELYGHSEYIWSYPDGPVPLDSPLYIERPPIEKLAYQEITQPGCVIRIRSPRDMGKSSLVLRLLAFAQKQRYHTVKLDCDQIDSLCMVDLSHFFRFFCWRVAKELGIDPNIDAYWDEEMGRKISCSLYFKNYLLKQIKRPVVLVLEQADRFFEHAELAQEFFTLLRSWHEEGRRDPIWQKLRLVVVYSTEVYVSLDINRSPFNIGLPLRLPEFTEAQVKELATRHGLDWSYGNEVTQLMSLIGGHPALVRISLYNICSQKMTLEQLIQEAIANGGIYRHHLWRHWATLQEQPSLMDTYTKILAGRQSTSVDPVEICKLDNLGVISYEGDRIKPRCELYRAYFEKQLSVIS
ncbi:AAA-like domain-containing protein [Pelatocladus sp. BLCC-F211]|uniref:AAA-like domain-containing protein n=1 Tax=Pelatocladus sp. BLCC-F211 TaxID=3342752 RepID=UPI0035B6EE9A